MGRTEIELKINHVRLEDLPPADQARIKYHRNLLRMEVGRIIYERLQRELAKERKQKTNNGKEAK